VTAFNRRKFLEGLVAVSAAVGAPGGVASERPGVGTKVRDSRSSGQAIDFRYAPRLSQATICFPDDPMKSLIGQAGDLRYGFAQDLQVGMEDFATVCRFSLAGMPDDRVVRQWLEAPHIPIVHTLGERPTATFELTAFATRHANEGRVDNVLLSIRSRKGMVGAVPRVHIRTCAALKPVLGSTIVVTDASTNAPFLVAAKSGPADGFATWWEESGFTLYLPHGEATPEEPAQYFIRLPQEGQSVEMVQEMVQHPDALANEARRFWKEWKPYGSTAWSLPGKPGEFLTACARNIQQAREVKDGRLVFQVGPTVYRGLWIVDGNFLLEAARYLGYDKEADDGLLAEWAKQVPSGQVVAAVPGEHWKDTAIAMFTLVRQCELKQDWQFFKDLEPNVLRAIDFLVKQRDAARAGNSTNGRYGLLAPGFADGGLGGVRSEFTNTVWTLAGLKAVATAAERLQMDSLRLARAFYEELRTALTAAAKQEMVRHPAGFEYLPMLARDDEAWHDRVAWNRPRPQTAQWALSHAIFPGLVFEQNDPIVQGHIALLQSCTQEDIPAEPGWLWHESVWNYNASFAAHVYLWAGLKGWADRTFRGFLNHASPLYCWREEQPLQHALLGQDWGDMPHNWASAECVRYLRHMLVLEDGQRLRLLEGVTAANLAEREVIRLEQTPTRFGRANLQMESLSGRKGWRLSFTLETGQRPDTIELPVSIADHDFERIEGANFRRQDQKIMIEPAAKTWSAYWR
jgi:hypothetical protein